MKTDSISQNEVLAKIKDFEIKIFNVNQLYQKYLESKEKNDKKIFETAWINLLKEKSNFLMVGSFAETGYPNKKTILAERIINVAVTRTHLYSNGMTFPEKRSLLTSAKISYSIEDNQDDFSDESGFPYFGLSLILILGNGSKNVISIAIAKTKDGCNLIKPNFDVENLTITGRENEIQFERAEDLFEITKLCENTIELVNSNLTVLKLLRNIKFGQG